MDNNDAVFNVPELPFDDVSYMSSNAAISESEEHEPGEYPDYFCMRVDTALYHAKDYGKNKVVVE